MARRKPQPKTTNKETLATLKRQLGDAFACTHCGDRNCHTIEGGQLFSPSRPYAAVAAGLITEETAQGLMTKWTARANGNPAETLTLQGHKDVWGKYRIARATVKKQDAKTTPQ